MTLFLETNVTVQLFNESDNNRKARYMKLKSFMQQAFMSLLILQAPPPPVAHGGGLRGITAYCAALDGYVHGGAHGGGFGG